MKPTGVRDVELAIGRGAVFVADAWTPGLGDNLFTSLQPLGMTDGDITIQQNGQVEVLTLPEVTGGAPHAADFVGEAPTVELPLIVADPDLRDTLSPSGSKHGGRSMRAAVAEKVLVIFPDELFKKRDADGNPVYGELTYAGGAFLFDGQALDAAQEALLAKAVWFWRGYFDFPQMQFKGGAGDAKKEIQPSTFHAMWHPDMPEGHALYTRGDPGDSDIDIAGGS